MISQQYDLRWLFGYLAYCENNNYLNQRLFGALCQGSHQIKPFSEGAVPPSLREQTSSLGSYGCQSEAHSSLHSRAQDSILCSISCLEWWEMQCLFPHWPGDIFPLGPDMAGGNNYACFCFAHTCELLFSE